MSEFSDLLTLLVSEKEIKIYSMAKYCGMDRSTLYKLMNGKRNPPSKDVFQKMSDYMHLTPAEHSAFQTAYEMSIIGRNAYYRRKGVEEFLLQFPSQNNVSTNPFPQFYTMDFSGNPMKKEFQPIHSKLDLYQIVSQLFIREAVLSDGCVSMLLQPDNKFILQCLEGLRERSDTFKIEHIFCLNSIYELSDKHHSLQLDYLANILPLYIRALNYHPFYFYENIPAHCYSFNLFPYMILAGDTAILCTSDYENGLLFHDSGTVFMLRNLFETYKKGCKPLFHLVSSVEEKCSLIERMSVHGSTTYIIQPEPWLYASFSDSLIDRTICREIPQRESVIASLSECSCSCRKDMSGKEFIHFNTRQGILTFAETGMVNEFSRELYNPLTISQRIELLKEVEKDCLVNPHYLLKDPLDALPQNFHLCINSGSGYLLFQNAGGQNVYLIIEESRLLETFLDYAENLAESCCLSTEETMEFLHTVISLLEEA